MLWEYICDPKLSLQNVCRSLDYTYFRVYLDSQSVHQTFTPSRPTSSPEENSFLCGKCAILRLSYDSRNLMRTLSFSRA